MVDAVGVGRDAAFNGEGLYLEVVLLLLLVFQLVDVVGDEGYQVLAEAHVEQVVAQREVKQLALPDLLAGEVTLVGLGKVVLVEFTYLVCGVA